MGGISRALFGGSDQQQQSGLDPRFFDLYNQNVQYAKGVANNLQAKQIAGFTDLQNQGLSGLSGINSNAGMGATAQGLQGLQGLQSYQPQQVETTSAATSMAAPASINRSAIRDVSGGSFLSGNVGAYMNPYQDQVINQSMSDIDRQRQLAGQSNNAQAVGAHAFGGSRQAVQSAENDRNYADTFARTAAGLRSQGFDTAAGLMNQDLTRGLQAQGMNQSQDANVANQNAGFSQQASLANAGALNNASQFNAGQANSAAAQNAANGLSAAQLQAGAANGLVNGGQAYNQSFLGNIAAQLQGGSAQQNLTQQQLDAQRNLELERLNAITGAIGVNPGGGAGQTSSGSGSSDQGLFGAFFK